MNRATNETTTLIRWPFGRTYNSRIETTTRIVKDALTGIETQVPENNLLMPVMEYDQMYADMRGKKIIICLGICVLIAFIVVGSIHLSEWLKNKE